MSPPASSVSIRSASRSWPGGRIVVFGVEVVQEPADVLGVGRRGPAHQVPPGIAHLAGARRSRSSCRSTAALTRATSPVARRSSSAPRSTARISVRSTTSPVTSASRSSQSATVAWANPAHGPAARVEHRPRVALDPQLQQRAVLLRRQPRPQLAGDDCQIAVAGRPRTVEQLELVATGPGEERANEAGLRAEQEQEDARARAHGRGERPQRQVRHPVLERVSVGALE